MEFAIGKVLEKLYHPEFANEEIRRQQNCVFCSIKLRASSDQLIRRFVWTDESTKCIAKQIGRLVKIILEKKEVAVAKNLWSGWIIEKCL